MKTLAEINQLHEEFSKRFGIPSVANAQQGSAEWFQVKLGVLSASNASEILAGKKTATRNTYMAELVAQVCTGQFEEINSKYTDWGHQHEDAARSLYEFQNNLKENEMSCPAFVFADDTFRVGCSPDGLLFPQKKGLQLKCPYKPVHYVQFFVDGKIKPEYEYQVQFEMRTLGADQWDVCQYHPLMLANPIKTLSVPKNVETWKRLDDAIPEFIHDMDLMLKTIGVTFGDQWKRLAPAPLDIPKTIEVAS